MLYVFKLHQAAYLQGVHLHVDCVLGTLHVVLAPVKVQLPQAVLVSHPLARVFDHGTLVRPVFKVPLQCLVGAEKFPLEHLHLHNVSSCLVLGRLIIANKFDLASVGLKLIKEKKK